MSEETQKELKELESKKLTLEKMEKDLKSKADEVDHGISALAEKESKHAEKEKAFSKKLGVVDASSVFDDMVTTVNKLYTAYYSIKGTDEGLLEALQSILKARQSINTK